MNYTIDKQSSRTFSDSILAEIEKLREAVTMLQAENARLIEQAKLTIHRFAEPAEWNQFASVPEMLADGARKRIEELEAENAIILIDKILYQHD
jgi:tRNA G37 N-methylase TrmD